MDANMNIERVAAEFYIKFSIQYPENAANLLESITDLINSEENPENKTIIVATTVNQIFNGPRKYQLVQLAPTFNAMSMIVIFSSENFDKFFINWKVRNSKVFYELEEIEKKSQNLNFHDFYQFLVDFLVNCLRTYHLGVPHYFNQPSILIPVRLDQLIDCQNFNLLQLAAELGNVNVIEFLINLDLFDDQPCVSNNPQSLALSNHHFDAVSMMISKNFSYPLVLDFDQCSDDARRVCQESRGIHDAIMAKNAEKVKQILYNNRNLKHFYNLSNESAVKVAVRSRAFKIYDILLANGVRLGSHESLTEICQNLKESDKRKIRLINLDHNIGYQGHVLYRNSYLSHDSTNQQKEFKYIKKAFKTLSRIPMINVIMKVVEASKNFQIIFDFNRNSVEVMDPTAPYHRKGSFYLNGVIYIGAKGLLNPVTEFDVLGCLAQQLCHFALNLVYDNLAKPYGIRDEESRKNFNEIVEKSKINQEKEEMINFAFDCYPNYIQKVELIARVPHLLVMYHNNPERLMDVKANFLNLFDYFEHKVIPELQAAIPEVQKKVKQDQKKKDNIIKKFSLHYNNNYDFISYFYNILIF